MEEKDLNLHSETIDKAIDIVANSTEQTRNALDKNTAGGVNKFFQLLAASPLGIAIDTYIAERPYKLELAKQNMLKKYNAIPKDNLIDPRTSIALTVAKEFDYYLYEEHIKEMFTNILVSDMDNRRNKKVHPSFIEIVKQLSSEDAKDLKFLKETQKNILPIMKIKYDLTSSGFIYPEENMFLMYKNSVYKSDLIVINNLVRLNLIELDFGCFVTKKEIYEQGFNKIKSLFELPTHSNIKELGYEKGILKITPYGKDFIDICLS